MNKELFHSCVVDIDGVRVLGITGPLECVHPVFIAILELLKPHLVQSSVLEIHMKKGLVDVRERE